MTVEVVYPEGDEAAVEWLAQALPGPWDGPFGVGVELPRDWTPAGDPFVVVDLTSTPTAFHPIEEHQTVRLIAYADRTSVAKRLCARAQSVLLVHPTIKVQYLTGATTDKDPSTGAHITARSVRMVMRAQAA